ncbi:MULTISPECIES: HAMP domain-containing sensor histidine kinase [unclassified Acinetobacter]|uniref:sensor histidine kinase n=1 Tax=unclassified Acinetobacter TaxID=196816 RepID=UPI0015D376C7|nr:MULTISPECIES: ATP-binding protein [unclassified Acinetobacter]
MKQTGAVSLQKTLVKTSVLSSMIAGLLALVLLFAVSIYQTMQLQDEIMDEAADMLLLQDISSGAGEQVDELTEQFKMHYQLRLGQQTLTETEDFPLAPATITQQEEGFSFVWANQRLWRVYVASDDDLSVLMTQKMNVRFQEIWATGLGYAAILILLWLIQWGIVHFAIHKQFRSLQALSAQIAQKHVQDLSPVQSTQPELLELQPMVQQLNRLLSRLEHSLEAEQRFTSDASHELRSPLSAIQMRLQVLKRKYQDQPQLAEDLAQIQRDVNRGTQVLENLLLLARLDPAHLQDLPITGVDLQKLVLDVLEALAPFSLEKQIKPRLQLQPAIIQASPELLYTCIRNLIDNAIRYATQQGEVVVSITCKAEQVQLCIENNGQEVSDEVLQRLGERFYRALGTQTQGSGLGISICKKIISLHQGQLQFSRSALGGLLVKLSLPGVKQK